jgi:hypothetical protein
MKSFRQYITEVERYQQSPKGQAQGLQNPGIEPALQVAWDWTLGPMWDLLRLSPMLDGGPPFPPVVIDQYPWEPDNLGTWNNPPEGWRLKDPLNPLNDPDNWVKDDKPKGDGWKWNPGPADIPGRGKWIRDRIPGYGGWNPILQQPPTPTTDPEPVESRPISIPRISPPLGSQSYEV